MLVKVIYVIGALVGAWSLRTTKDVHAMIITIMLLLSTVLALLGRTVTLAMLLHFASLVTVSWYAFFRLPAGGVRGAVLAMALPVLVVMFLGIIHSPGAGIVPFILVVSIWTYVQRIVPMRDDFRNEFGFVTVLCADAVGILVVAIGG